MELYNVSIKRKIKVSSKYNYLKNGKYKMILFFDVTHLTVFAKKKNFVSCFKWLVLSTNKVNRKNHFV